DRDPPLQASAERGPARRSPSRPWPGRASSALSGSASLLPPDATGDLLAAGRRADVGEGRVYERVVAAMVTVIEVDEHVDGRSGRRGEGVDQRGEIATVIVPVAHGTRDV